MSETVGMPVASQATETRNTAGVQLPQQPLPETTDGIIFGYRAVIDPSAVGCAYEPLVWVTLKEITRESMATFEAAIVPIQEIVEALRMMGQPDYLLRIATADPHTFEQLYFDHLAGLPHVQTLTSQLAMKAVKRATILPVHRRS